MASASKKNLYLVALGIVAAAVIGYFIWLFIAPPSSVAPYAEELPQIEVQTGFVNADPWRSLHPFAELPITPANVGRPNPFDPIINLNANQPVEGAAAPNEEGNANANAPAPMGERQ